MSMDPAALYRIEYGLYLVTTRDGQKDNGMIVNAVQQLTATPELVAVTVNKQTYSHDLIEKSGVMNVHCLAERTPFSVFERFGLQSGRAVDKFEGLAPDRTENGLALWREYATAYLSLAVERYVDMGTHGMFICRITASEVLTKEPTMTYSYYHKAVKPKPAESKKKGYVCKICGYVYEGDPLPADFVCPLCLHGAADFEPLQ